MKKIIALSLGTVLISLVGCALAPAYIPQRDRNYAVTRSPAMGRVGAAFHGHEHLRELEKERAIRELREPRFTGISTVGRIDIRIVGGSLAETRPSNILFILVDNSGREIVRRRGNERTIPNHNGSFWVANESISINDDTIEFPLSLRTIRSGNEIVDITINRNHQRD